MCGILSYPNPHGRYVLSAPSRQLETLPGTLMLTDCLEACQANESCSAVNYETGLCVMFRSTADQLPGEWGTIAILSEALRLLKKPLFLPSPPLHSTLLRLLQVHFRARSTPSSRFTHRNPASVCVPAPRPGALIVCRATVCQSMPSPARVWPHDATASSCVWAKRNSPVGKCQSR